MVEEKTAERRRRAKVTNPPEVDESELSRHVRYGKNMTTTTSQSDVVSRIGVMADSHGQVGAIAAALGVFRSRGCQRIYHLGDVCDSVHPETADACVRLLAESGVVAIKGNNDHTIVANLQGNAHTGISVKTARFLRQLPLREEYETAVFVHSLPFVNELGLASMLGVMGNNECRQFFETHPHKILFRGHSHSPELRWAGGGKIHMRKLEAGDVVDLEGRLPCMVTCGALTRGLCMIWRTDRNSVEIISLR